MARVKLLSAKSDNKAGIFIIAGHGGGDPGAIAHLNTISLANEKPFAVVEAELNSELRDLVASQIDGRKFQVLIDDDADSTATVWNKLGLYVEPSDVVIDLHFNAFTSPFATGTEIFVRRRGLPMQQEVESAAKAIAQTLSVPVRGPRGVKVPSESARGRLGLFERVNTEKVALIEPCFITNPNDYLSYMEKKKEIAMIIANFAENLAKQ